jgi:hypothetical protein
MIVMKAYNMAEKMNIPVIGLVKTTVILNAQIVIRNIRFLVRVI